MIAPSQYSTKKPQKKSSLPSRTVVYGLIGILAVAAICVIFSILPKDNAKQNNQAEKNKGDINEVVPVKIVPKQEEAAAEKPKRYKDLTREEKLARIRAKYGDNIPDNLKGEVYFLENPPQETYHPAKTKSDIFKFRSERVIASLLRVEPGDFMLQKRIYDEKFDRDFAASLEEKIEFADTDTDEERALKQAVIDTKNDILSRMQEGETPSALLNDVTDNLYELGRYKRDLQEQLAKFRNDPTYTDQDIQDFVTAANEMLASKGASPIPMPSMLIRQVSLKRAAKRAAEKELKEKNK